MIQIFSPFPGQSAVKALRIMLDAAPVRLVDRAGARLGAGAWLCLLAGTLMAAPLPADWKYVQSVRIDQSGLVKISVPVETIDAARGGLEDLRLYDEEGRELPCIVERPVQPPIAIQSAKACRVVVGDGATTVNIDTGLTQAVAGVTLEIASRDFIKAVRVEGAWDDRQWEILAEGVPIFRQPDGASNLQIGFAPRVWPRLRLTLDDRRSAPIPVTGARLHAAGREPAPSEPFEMEIVEREDAPGQTRLMLQAAGANVVLAGLTVETPESLFTRRVTLSFRDYVENEVREKTLASGTIYRVAVEGREAAEALDFAEDVWLPVRECILTIHNGDSPSLQIAAIHARRRPVYLTWHADRPGSFFLLSGNPRCAAPHYDIAELSRSLLSAPLTPASPSALASNAEYRAREALPELQDTGITIDLAKWASRKRIELAAPGVQQLELDLETVSHAASDFRDLRVVCRGKQLPYLLERTSVLRALTPEVEQAPDPKRPTISRWVLRLPQNRLPVLRLECETGAPFFKREAVLKEQIADERGIMHWVWRGAATWVREPGQRPEKLLIVINGAVQSDHLVLEIDNGDNAPLVLANFQLHYPATRLLFKAPPSEDTYLYYGHSGANAPRYDIELIARQLLAAQKNKAALGQAEILRKSPWQPGDAPGWVNWLFWIALAGVVVGLLVVIARLLPKKSE